jgi:hypothetical protein
MFTAETAASTYPGMPVGHVNQVRLPERVLEQLPLARDRGAGTMRIAHRWERATLRVDERLYGDSWMLKATTTDLRFFLDAGRRFTYGPHARFHAQSAASFWRRAYVANRATDVPALRTGDRELGPLWSATFGPGARWWIGPAGDPRSFALGSSLEGTWTVFLDDLYIRNRLAVLVLVTSEGTF